MTVVLKQDSTINSNIMHLNVGKEDFLAAIGTASGAVGTKATIAILNNLLFQTNGPDELFVTGTDLELGVRTRCAVRVENQGAVTIPARKLVEIVRELPSAEIEITVAKNNAVNIKTANSFFKIMGLGADDFPKLPESKAEKTCELDQEVLRRCLTLTSFAISRDEARYTLNGVLVILRNKLARFVATDGKRLATIEVNIDLPSEVNIEAIIPAKTVFELIKALSIREKVQLLFTETQAVFQLPKTTFFSRLIEGRFPNHEQVIPKEETTTAKIKREELLSGMRRVAILTSQENQPAKLDFTKGRVLLSSRSPNLGESREEIAADISGDDLTIGFNPNYIIDALKNLDVEEISLSMTEPDKPGLIKTSDGYLYVVMPMQLS